MTANSRDSRVVQGNIQEDAVTSNHIGFTSMSQEIMARQRDKSAPPNPLLFLDFDGVLAASSFPTTVRN